MATKMTINRVSTCQSAGTENYENFQTGIGRRKRTLVQYDYRHTDGELPHGRGTFLLCQTHIRRMSSRTGQVANGKGKEGGQAMNEAGYQTLIVKFSEPITVLDGMFDDAEAWGVDTLKGWIDNYESSRFTAIDSHTAVITSEYNMECLKEWLERCTPITEKTEF